MRALCVSSLPQKKSLKEGGLWLVLLVTSLCSPPPPLLSPGAKMGFFTFIKVMMILFNLAIFVSAGAVPTRGHPLSAVPPGWAVGLGSTLSLGAVGSLAPLVFPKPLVGGNGGQWLLY